MIDINSLKPEMLEKITFACLVVNNNDPTHRGMLQLRFPLIHDEIKNSQLPWARPDCFINGLNIPRVGKTIHATFERGDKSTPVYTSEVLSKTSLKGTPFESDYPFVRGFFDGKNFITLNEKTGKVSVFAVGDIDVITPSGNIKVGTSGDVSFNGTNITADASASLNLKGGADATLDAPTNTVSGDTITVTGGTMVDVNSGGLIKITGVPVSINNGNLLVL